ncbi:MAG: hypothetical protein ABIO92_03940 [Chloroflexia bacterium]
MYYFGHRRFLLRVAFLLLFCTAVSLTGIFAPVISAAPLQAVPGHSITLEAGSTATIAVRGLALQPGASIATDRLALATDPLASDRVRTTLFYALEWGYTESAPDQVALAVWYAQDGIWRDPGHTVAERMAAAAGASQGTPSWRPDGRSLLPLVGEKVQLEDFTLTPLAPSPAIGRGHLTVRNTSEQDVVIYLPYGTLFTGPSGAVLVWATAPDDPEVEPPSNVTPTETTVLADPPPAEETATPSYKNGSTPVAASTPSYKATRPSPTPVEGAKATPADTKTPVPTEVVQDDPTTEPSPTVASTLEPTVVPAIKTRPQPPSVDKPQKEIATENSTGSPAASPMQTPKTEVALLPQSSVSGPPPELPKAQATIRNVIPVPSPVSTKSVPTETADKLPEAVATGRVGTPQPTLPRAQPTTGVPIVITPSRRISTPNPTATQEPKKESEAAGSIDGRSSSDGSTSASASGSAAAPTTPTPQPQPVPVAPEVKEESPPVTVRSSDNVPAKEQQGATAAQIPASSPPTNAPSTGGGPSGLGTWLAACAALLLIAGLRMRRASAPEAVPVCIEQSR